MQKKESKLQKILYIYKILFEFCDARSSYLKSEFINIVYYCMLYATYVTETHIKAYFIKYNN